MDKKLPWVDWMQPPYPWVKATWVEGGADLLHANGETLRIRKGDSSDLARFRADIPS